MRLDTPFKTLESKGPNPAPPWFFPATGGAIAPPCIFVGLPLGGGRGGNAGFGWAVVDLFFYNFFML